MIPRPFEYERPESLEEAIELLAGAGERDVQPLAGGQSLVPAMSLGLARPDLLVDLGALELAGLEAANGHVRVGARTTHRTLELSAEARDLLPLAAEAAAWIGNPRVRNRGTFGGSLAHADPAAELGAVFLACGGTVVARGADRERRIAAVDFFTGRYTTALAPDELVVAVEVERAPEGSGAGFEEAADRADDFATAAAAVVATPDADARTCGEARIALAGVGDRPVRVAAAEEHVRGEAVTPALLAEVERAVAEAVEPEDEPGVSAAYRRRVAGICARRALERAWGRAR